MPEGGRRLLRPRDELSNRGLGAGLHRGRAAGSRRRHREEPAVRAAPRTTSASSAPATWRFRAVRERMWLVLDRSALRHRPAARLASTATSRYTLYVMPVVGASTIAGHEASARLALLPAGRRRRRPAAAEVRPVPAGARDRDARARARTTRSGSTRDAELRVADAGLGAPRALHRPEAAASPREELHGKEGVERALVHARLARGACSSRTRTCSWNLTAIPAAIRIARKEKIDVVVTTSPPNSVHLVGAAVQEGDRREVGRRPARLARRASAPPSREPGRVRAKEKVDARRGPARRPLGRRDHRASPTRSPRRRAASRRAGKVVTISNGCDFDDFAGLDYTPDAAASGSPTPAASSASATRGRS